MKLIDSGRIAGLVMPMTFALAIVFCLVRVGQTATNEYFVQKPAIEWNHTTDGQPKNPVVTWRSADANATWEVRYRPLNAQRWRKVLARVLRRVDSELLTQHVVYDASLSDLAPGQACEFSVYRNQMRVYSSRVTP